MHPHTQGNLVTKFIVVLEHPTYSPHLVPCDFFPFLTMENQLKELHLGNPENVQMVTMAILNILQKTSRKSFNIWKQHWNKFIAAEENYFAGDHCS
jgi:hypothetical protein